MARTKIVLRQWFEIFGLLQTHAGHAEERNYCVHCTMFNLKPIIWQLNWFIRIPFQCPILHYFFAAIGPLGHCHCSSLSEGIPFFFFFFFSQKVSSFVASRNFQRISFDSILLFLNAPSTTDGTTAAHNFGRLFRYFLPHPGCCSPSFDCFRKSQLTATQSNPSRWYQSAVSPADASILPRWFARATKTCFSVLVRTSAYCHALLFN